MKTVIKRFSELTTDELYDIIKLRVDVFVVEQNCPYAELDGLDKDAVHVWIEDGDGSEAAAAAEDTPSGDSSADDSHPSPILAYLRVMDRGAESEHVSIGRVIAARRRSGLGSAVMKAGIQAAKDCFGADSIYLEAQCCAVPFYEKLGFEQILGDFVLDGIPHVKMLRRL